MCVWSVAPRRIDARSQRRRPSFSILEWVDLRCRPVDGKVAPQLYSAGWLIGCRDLPPDLILATADLVEATLKSDGTDLGSAMGRN